MKNNIKLIVSILLITSYSAYGAEFGGFKYTIQGAQPRESLFHYLEAKVEKLIDEYNTIPPLIEKKVSKNEIWDIWERLHPEWDRLENEIYSIAESHKLNSPENKELMKYHTEIMEIYSKILKQILDYHD